MNLLREFHGPNAAYIIELYERYRQDPESVDASTREQFSHWTPPVDGVTDGGAAPAAVVPSTQVDQIVHTANLAQAIREYGRLLNWKHMP
jgi:2-oxoglutarate dehydrogenase E1 component